MFAKSVLYRLHIKNKHSSVEPEQNINPTINPSANEAASMMMKNLPSSLKIKLVQPITKPQIEKNWMCAQCKKCFKDQKYLRKHMQDVHKLEPLSLTKADYLELPSVESTHNRCLPCNKSFPNSLRYKIHIKDSHDKKEPTENFDAENCAQPEDFICLICVKKFATRKSLRIHIYKTHLGSTPEDERVDGSNENKEEKDKNVENKEVEEQDPLADPLDIKNPTDGQEDLNSKETLQTESNNVEVSETKNVDDKSKSKDEPELNGSPKIKTVNIENITEKVGDDDKSDSKEKKDVEEMDIDKDTNVEEPIKTVSDENKDVQEMDVDHSNDIVDPKPPSEDKTELKDKEEPSTKSNKDEDDIVIIDEPKTSVQPKILSDKEKKLIEKMLHMLKKYGCAFCSNRFDTKYALSFHERTHLKEKKSPKKEEKKLKPIKPIQTPKKPKVTDDEGTPKVRKNTKMGSVQLHDNTTGPVCFKCDQVCKDNSNYKNHILSHYYREFDKHIPQVKPFECPICSKPSRDKITLIRHYAFTHQKMFELTDITPEQLLPPGFSGTPKTPKTKPNKIANESETPKLGPNSPSGSDSPMVTETSSLNEESADVQSNGIDNNELGEQDDKKEESIRKDKEEDEPEDEKEKDTNTEEEKDEDEKPMEQEKILDQNDKASDEENLKNTENIEEKEGADTEKMDSFATELSDNKENEEEVV